MTAKKKFLTQRQYAKHRGVNEQAVAKAIRTGRITATKLKDGSKKIDVTKADAQWAANTFAGNVRKNGKSILQEPTAAPAADAPAQPPSSAGNDYAKARAIRENLHAQRVHLDLEQRRGKLISVDAVKIEFFNMSRLLRNAYQSLPDRVSAILASTTDAAEVHKILSDEILKILENLTLGNRA